MEYKEISYQMKIVAVDELEGFKIGHKSESETSLINIT